MSVWTVYQDWVKPERLDVYQEKVRQLAERANAAADAFKWAAYQTAVGDPGRFYYGVQAADFAEMASQGTAEDLVKRVFGEKEGATWLREVRTCLLQEDQTIAIDRTELSFTRTAQPPPSMAMVTAVRVRPDGREAFEEFVRKIAEAIPKVDEPGALMTHQIVVGNLRDYRLIRPLQSLADLGKVTQASELLTQAFGTAEGGLIFRTGTAAAEHVERRIVSLRQELSHRA